ncbi:MAG: hypothetical protein M1276_08380 [Deltaproteobacteria bacterium]|nr:hypothetical protein [Deltaproteobacteria bacterium]
MFAKKKKIISATAFICTVVLLFAMLACPIKSFAGGPDGIANNFINQNPFAFSMHKPNTFVSFDAMQYAGFNQVYNNNGELVSKPTQEQFLFIPAFVWTYKFLKKVNFFEVAFPVGKQSMQNTISQTLPNGKPNIMFTNGYQLTNSGTGNPVIFYGIEVWHQKIGKFRYNFMPMLVTVIPNNWNSSSVNNIGSDEFNLEFALTGGLGYQFNKKFGIALDYAISESDNLGHNSINYAEATLAAPTAANANLVESPTGGGSYTNPGNNFILNTYLRFIFFKKLEVFNETVFENQSANYGWFNTNPLGEPSTSLKYGYLNSGYQTLMTGLGVSYHYGRAIYDVRLLKTLHAKNGPDLTMGLLSVTIPFKF